MAEVAAGIPTSPEGKLIWRMFMCIYLYTLSSTRSRQVKGCKYILLLTKTIIHIPFVSIAV